MDTIFVTLITNPAEVPQVHIFESELPALRKAADVITNMVTEEWLKDFDDDYASVPSTAHTAEDAEVLELRALLQLWADQRDETEVYVMEKPVKS